MYLKRIELEGFKSFADRTVVPVQRGLTGIVGPNGCGKSNVVDALLWVLGERSAKALRADAMEDVIFKGAEGRAAAPYAMVEIILGDDKGEVVEMGGEVAVGRRLFRTGESEFLLNGRKVRRKDVREMLMDTGLGVRGYMVLAQGKIDAVLAANPDERRSVFEEAAGISRYKERKRETERKLKHVGQDLARVDDVLDEVQRAVRSLRYQAGKARRFLEMRDRYRELRVRVGLSERGRLLAQEAELSAVADQLEQQIEGLKNERSQVEERLHQLEAEEEALRGRFDGLRLQASENKEKVAGLEERVHGLEARAAEADQRRERDTERLQQLELSGRERSDSEKELEEQMQALAQQRERAETSLAEAETVFETAKQSYRSLRDRLECMRRDVLAALSERTKFHNEVANATRQRSEAEGGLKARQRRLTEVEAEEKKLAWEHESSEQKAVLGRQAVVSLEAQVMELLEQQEHLRGEAKGHAEAAGEARRRAAAAEARLEALAGVEDDMQGLPKQVRDALNDPIDGVKGLLLEKVQVAAPWDRLLEDLLGRMQNALWLESPDHSQALGEGAFDVFYPLAAAGSDPAPTIEDATALRDQLQGEQAYIDALCARLGAVYTVKDATTARRLSAMHSRAVFLSADGQLHGNGFARIGMLSEDSAGLLARRNAREDASRRLRSAEAEYTRAHAREAEVNARLQEVGTTLAEAEATHRDALSEREKAEARLQECLDRKKRAAEEQASILLEAEQLQQLVTTAQDQESQAGRKRDEAEQRRVRVNAELEAAQGQAEAEGQGFERASALVQEARIEANRVRQSREHMQSRMSDAHKLGQKESAEISKLRSELDELVKRAEELRLEAETARTTRSELLEVRGELSIRVEEAGVQLERASSALTLERDRRSGEANRMDQLMEARQSSALEVQKVQMEAAGLTQGLIEEFGQDLENLAQGLAIQPLDPLLGENGQQLEFAPLQEELGDLKRKIEAIGAVNLDAVAELEEREERENFLVRERDDLNQARGNLEDTLEELDTKCRTRFLETFEAVQGNFEHIFRRLFRGGRASLALSEGEDPLNAGIDINVRPPGKELRSINLLSGGERTLTALALLLAVFQSRPSPFCLLDEVDAALDDSNVERFIDAVQHFTGQTQFVVVTHNRITMARCERLFGVTMRKRGVSMVVSVELSEIPESMGERFELAGEALSTSETASRSDRGAALPEPSSS
jgi:chromosome segregation protein